MGACLGGARGVFQAGFLQHRQAVHVGAHHHQGAGAVLQHGHQAGAAYAGGHLKPDLGQLARHALGGLVLGQAQLRIAVEVFKKCAQMGFVVVFYGILQLIGQGWRCKA